MIKDLKRTPFQKIEFFSPRIITNTLFGIALLIIILINIFSFLQVSKLASANQLVIHTYRVIQAIDEGFLSLIKVESTARGYMITKNQYFLQDIEANKTKMYQNFNDAKQLTKDNEEQQKRIQLLAPLLNQRMDLINQITKSGFEPEKTKLVELVNQGNVLSQKIYTVVMDINSDELHLLENRNSSFIENIHRLNYILLATSVITALFIVLGLIVLNRNLTRQQHFLHDKLRYENLLGSIIEGTKDVILVLDLNYRFTIFNHSFENEFKSLFGTRPRLGISILDLLAHVPDEQRKIGALWKRALQGEEFSLIGEFGSSSENKTCYECNFNSIYDEKGLLIGASAICRNIEHRIEAEKSLKATNEKLEQVNDKLKHHNTEISLLNEMENSLQSCSTINEALIIISKYCQKLLPFTRGVMYLINASRNYLEAVAEWNKPEIKEKIFSPNQCWGLRQGKNYIYINNSMSIGCEHMPGQDGLSYICVPLLAQNEVIGLLNMVIIDSEKLSEEEIKAKYQKHEFLFKNLAVQLALAIANIQLRETLKTRAIRDPLTELYNRSYLNEFLERDLLRSQRNKVPVAIVMMDIDYFKKLNDKYGHDAGDVTLREFGKLLKNNIRGSDIACRYGGEEFLLIFYDTTEEVACERIEKIRELVNHLEVSLRGTILDKITASFGLAVFPEDGVSVETLITAADQALFHSKKNGRNQLTVYSQFKNLDSGNIKQ